MGIKGILLYSTAISIYTLMVIGAYVAAADYGLACPDWPTCYGSIVPSFTLPVLVEYTHRLFAALSAVLLFITTYLFWRDRADSMEQFTFLSLASLLMIMQILLGAIVVGSYLDPALTTLHQASAMLIFGLVIVAMARGRRF